jgi:hypothetical protein
MSAARRRKKAAGGSSALARFERLSDLRYERDPSFLTGQLRASAPVKYARCTVCVGRPHHSIYFGGGA